MTDNTLVAINVFEEAKDQPAAKTDPQTSNAQEQQTTSQSGQVSEQEMQKRKEELNSKTVAEDPVRQTPQDNTLLYGGLFIGFMVLLLVGLVIIRKLNKKK